MAQAQYIKHLYENEEKSLREIARITELSFQTVQNGNQVLVLVVHIIQ